MKVGQVRIRCFGCFSQGASLGALGAHVKENVADQEEVFLEGGLAVPLSVSRLLGSFSLFRQGVEREEILIRMKERSSGHQKRTHNLSKGKEDSEVSIFMEKKKRELKGN